MRIIACFATTLDGKIASAAHPRDRIGSEADMAHLRNVRNQADAILCGGSTFRAYPNVRKGSLAKNIPLQCLLTRSFDLPENAPVFHADPAVPVVVFSPAAPSDEILSRYPAQVTWIATGEQNPAETIIGELENRGVQTLLVEGGGHVMSLFLQAQAVHELYLTLCPLFLGGEHDPSLVTGPGFTVADAPRTEVLASRWEGQELYLHLKIHYPGTKQP